MLREADVLRIEATALNRASQDPRSPGLRLVEPRPFDWSRVYAR